MISFIYKRTVIQEILTHLNIYKEKKNQRAPPTVEPEYAEPVVVPFDDGWPEYEEAVIEF
jgi:hypothetical protein